MKGQNQGQIQNRIQKWIRVVVAMGVLLAGGNAMAETVEASGATMPVAHREKSRVQDHSQERLRHINGRIRHLREKRLAGELKPRERRELARLHNRARRIREHQANRPHQLPHRRPPSRSGER